MITIIITKIRALIFDLAKPDTEAFTYESSDIFTIAESNVASITSVKKNGVALGTGEYSFNSTTNEVTLTLATGSEAEANDIIEIKYTYYKYSDTELTGYITACLVWISNYSYGSTSDYELEEGEIFPTPNNKTTDLISLISSILIKPNYSEYRLPNVIVRYPRTVDKDDKIKKIITRFQESIGINDVLELD